jgi:predicted protein tyrosine phosphatase
VPYLERQTYIHRIAVSDHERPIDCYSPNEHTIDEILYFSSLLTEEDDVLIHCWAGKSRSTAAALIILYDKLKDVDKAKEILLKIRPQAAPNRLICSLADKRFGLVRKDDSMATFAENVQPFPGLVYGTLYDTANVLGIAQNDDKAYDGS